MPSARYHFLRSSTQYLNHSSSVPGLQKNSSSICSNSRERKVKLRGLISLRNDLPICAMPNGTLMRVEFTTFWKLAKMPCAVSGRSQVLDPESATGPKVVSNIRLNLRAGVSSPLHFGSGHTVGTLPVVSYSGSIS